MSWPESPFPTDARGLLILVGLLPIGLVLFLLMRFTGAWWAWLLFLGFVIAMLTWLYRRAS